MFRLEPRAFASEEEEGPSGCSWSVIAQAVRLHALGKSLDEAIDLNRWADLIEGIAALEQAKEPQAGTFSALASSSN